MGSSRAEHRLNLLCGGVAGASNIFTGFPFDTVKVRLQASPQGTYAGPWGCAKAIWRFEGVRGLYRGLAAPLVGGALETGVSYSVYTYSLAQLTTPGELPSLTYAVPVAAGLAGVVLSFVLAPFELIKCRMQMGSRDISHRYSGPGQCFQHLLKTEGPRGLTRGMGATVAREAPGNAIFFTVYEALRRTFPGRPTPDRIDHGILGTLKDSASAVTCGGLAGMFMWACILPLDVAKTRIQTAYPGSVHDIGILQNFRLMYQTGGRRVLYAGLTPTLVRAFPANAAQWLAWELSRRQLQDVVTQSQ